MSGFRNCGFGLLETGFSTDFEPADIGWIGPISLGKGQTVVRASEYTYRGLLEGRFQIGSFCCLSVVCYISETRLFLEGRVIDGSEENI